MPDITMCVNDSCLSNINCYRYTAKASLWQSYCSFGTAKNVSCEHFWPVKEKEMHYDKLDVMPSQHGRGWFAYYQDCDSGRNHYLHHDGVISKWREFKSIKTAYWSSREQAVMAVENAKDNYINCNNPKTLSLGEVYGYELLIHEK